MAPRKPPAPSAEPPYEPDRFYAVDLTRLVDWKGDPLCPGHRLEIRGAVLNAISDEQPGAIGDARPL